MHTLKFNPSLKILKLTSLIVKDTEEVASDITHDIKLPKESQK